MALAGARRRIGFAFTGGEALLTDVVADNGEFGHLADHLSALRYMFGVGAPGALIPRLRLLPEEKRVAGGIEPFIGFHFGASAISGACPWKKRRY